jgi:hypothetical protein
LKFFLTTVTSVSGLIAGILRGVRLVIRGGKFLNVNDAMLDVPRSGSYTWIDAIPPG